MLINFINRLFQYHESWVNNTCNCKHKRNIRVVEYKSDKKTALELSVEIMHKSLEFKDIKVLRDEYDYPYVEIKDNYGLTFYIDIPVEVYYKRICRGCGKDLGYGFDINSFTNCFRKCYDNAIVDRYLNGVKYDNDALL